MVIRRKQNGTEKKSRAQPRDRIQTLTILLFILAALLIVRLGYIQVFQHTFYEALAEGQHSLSEKLTPVRGQIYVHDRDGADGLYPLALNKRLFLAYAVPQSVQNPELVAKTLAPMLELEESEILPRLIKENDIYEPIKHKVTEEVMKQIELLKLPGIAFSDETERYYPEKNIASHVLGFLGFQGDKRVGQYGLEGYFEDELAGKAGYLQTEKDAQGRWISFGTRFFQEAQNGADIILTIDRTVEYEACTRLDQAVAKHGASGGSVIIMEPKTGAIIAMCGSPDFDPNNYNQVEDPNTFINPATFYVYEPGSVFKAFTMAAALDLGKVKPETTYTDTGSVEIGRYTIKNSDGKAHGVSTMTDVLVESLNTGAIFASREVGPVAFEEYVKKFDFGEKTGIQVNSEANGDISALADHKDIYTSTASFGQGITVTPIQLLAAFGAIANGGALVKPYIVDQIMQSNGVVVKTDPVTVRQVISSQTATTLSAMLVKVVQGTHGKRAGVPGYYVAGKTGTAQIARKDGPGYESDLTIGTFVGFAPVSNPRFVMLVKLDKPHDVRFAESTAAPLFGDIAKFLLQYYQVPPDMRVEE